MVRDNDRNAIRALSREYSSGSLPQQEYRKRRSAILDHLSNDAPAPDSVANSTPKTVWRKTFVFSLIALMLSLILLALSF